MPHGYSGTPVKDLFPLGQSVEASGGSPSLRAKQSPVAQVMSPSAVPIPRRGNLGAERPRGRMV